jgi:sugar diacid utilization regulator
MLLTLDEVTQVLLLGGESPDQVSRERAAAAVQSVVDAARAIRPDARIRAVVGDPTAPGDRLALAAARLRRIARATMASPGDGLVWARRRSLAALLGSLDPREASAFVDERLAALRAYDRDHRTDLQRVLELALDHQSRNTAARAAFMHRNTFRRQLAKAVELTDVDLADPEERLALHVALKLRRRR